jgi:two-component system OmpR family response regulator
MSTQKIVIVDDDHDAAEILQTYLQDYFVIVDYFDNGLKFLNHIRDGHSYDILLLDMKMPAISGIDTYKELIKIKDIPTMFVSSVTDPADKVACLEFGAVDYITKPFYLREVLARIKNAIRNTSQQNTSESGKHTSDLKRNGYEFSGWFLDIDSEILITPNKEEVMLTKGLYSLIKCFLNSPNRILSREQLMDDAQNHQLESFDRAIDAQISNLRKCFKKHDGDSSFIQTKHGSGYFFNAKVTQVK